MPGAAMAQMGKPTVGDHLRRAAARACLMLKHLQVARLRHHARTGDNGVFSRDAMAVAGPGPSNNLRFLDEPPLRAASAYSAPRTLPLQRQGSGAGRAGSSASSSSAARNRRGGNTAGAGLNGRRACGQADHQPDFNYRDIYGDLFDGGPPADPPPRPRGGRAQQQGGRFNGLFDDNLFANDNDWEDPDYMPAEPDNDDEFNRPRGALYQELLADAGRRQVAMVQQRNGWLGDLGGHVANLRRAVGLPQLGGWWNRGWGGGGGAGWNQPPAPPIPQGWRIGPGGVFNGRRKVRNYSVRHSHPKFDKRKCKGFERDVVPPPEPTDEEKVAASAPVPAKLDKGKGKAKAEDSDSDIEKLPNKAQGNSDIPPLDLNAAPAEARKTRKVHVPVCASCLSPLYLNEPAKARPHLLVCGHVVCASCIRAAKARVEAWYDAQDSIPVPQLEEEDEDSDDSGVDMPGKGKWKGSDLNERFEVVEGSSAQAGQKRKRAPNGRLPAIAPVHDRNRKARPGTAASSARSTPAAQTAAAAGRAKDKGKGKAVVHDEEEWRPDGAGGDDESGTGTSTSATTDESEPARKKAKIGSAASGVAGRLRRTDRPNMRESPVDGEEEEDVMNDGPRQPGAGGGSGKEKAAHLSIPLQKADTPSAGSTSKMKKGKQKATAADDPNVDENGVARINKNWLVCPVMGCLGDTDLQSDIGSQQGAWEMFV